MFIIESLPACVKMPVPEVREIIEAKIGEVKTERADAGVAEFLCPICGKAMERDAEKCQYCGYLNYESSRFRTDQQFAEIYNQRFQQYPRNAMYEYRVETVMDSAVLGKFEKNTVEHILFTYAKHGWRLHTAFTNEVGKNAVIAGIGVNSTIEQTVLIFERCIKPEDK